MGRAAAVAPASRRHVCWVVDDDRSYRERALAALAEGRELHQKTAAFGPVASAASAELGAVADMAADPYVDFLGRGAVDPERMFATFREESALARRQGYDGLRVVADMDWLLPAKPSTDDIVSFELRLDRVVGEVGATVVCAYRRSSFGRAAMRGTLCVHPERMGHDVDPPFCFVADDEGGWRLSGEVDRATLESFEAAFAAAVAEPCVIDVSGLGFIDVPGMRAIAQLARASGARVELRGARALKRYWHLAGFGALAPNVRLSESRARPDAADG